MSPSLATRCPALHWGSAIKVIARCDHLTAELNFLMNAAHEEIRIAGATVDTSTERIYTYVEML